MFVSAFKPLYDSIVARASSVPEAVALAIAFEDEQNLVVPRLYVSTAITSAGFARKKGTPIEEIIALNNGVSQALLTELLNSSAPYVEPIEAMVPTELGKVPRWTDSDYITFYFTWLTGLTAQGTAWVVDELADPAYAGILTTANTRDLSNETRWPSYQIFTEALLTKITVAERRREHKRTDGATRLLQLVDTGYSLGCRAERMFAESRGLDLLTITCEPKPDSELAGQLKALTELGASVGVDRTRIQITPSVTRA